MEYKTFRLYLINDIYFVLARDFGHAETIFTKINEDAIKSINLINENVIVEVKNNEIL